MNGVNLQLQVLRTDVSGMPLEWIGYQDAVRLISLDQVSYALGRKLFTIHGGINASVSNSYSASDIANSAL